MSFEEWSFGEIRKACGRASATRPGQVAPEMIEGQVIVLQNLGRQDGDAAPPPWGNGGKWGNGGHDTYSREMGDMIPIHSNASCSVVGISVAGLWPGRGHAPTHVPAFLSRSGR
jgi:hypothetical protein